MDISIKLIEFYFCLILMINLYNYGIDFNDGLGDWIILLFPQAYRPREPTVVALHRLS